MFSASEILSKIRLGQLTALEVTHACLNSIYSTDNELMAWAHVNRDFAIERAKNLDKLQSEGKTIGRLHGIPIGIKDIIDIAGIPTTCGSPILLGSIPDNSARIIQLLEAEGAVIIGKTVTTEFAFMNPSKTKNPHNLDYSPGGSSAGSAAAVAAGHVPITVGSQTNGSVIRPASFCGVFGLKPSAGIIPRVGVLETSDLLDQIGVFANHIEDLTLICDVLAQYDNRDPQSFSSCRPIFQNGLNLKKRADPIFGVVSFDYMDDLDADMKAGFDKLVSSLGNRVQKIDARPFTSTFLDAHKIIHEFQIFQNLGHYLKSNSNELSAPILEALERASIIQNDEFRKAVMVRNEASKFFENLFSRFDVIVTPSALGKAPLLSESTTGNPVCCTIWSLTGLPCINLPLLLGENELPLGIQLVGNYTADEKLIYTANWLLNFIKKENQGNSHLSDR